LSVAAPAVTAPSTNHTAASTLSPLPVLRRLCHELRRFSNRKSGFIKEGYFADLVIVNAGLPWM
jgi:dihydroorotase